MSLSLIESLSPGLGPYVDALLKYGKFGIFSELIRVTDLETGRASISDTPCGDRFKIVVPYAGRTVTWEVIFNSYEPSEPPDFIFSDQNFTPDIENIKSLMDWEPADPQCLLYAVKQLLTEYNTYRMMVMQSCSRLHFEYSSLLQHTKLSADEIEAHFNRTNEHITGPINFFIKLPVDFEKLPAYITKDNPGENFAVLLVTFESADSSKITPQLFLSPRVEHCLGGSAVLRIPRFPNGSCLMDYTPTICDLLQNKVNQVVSSYEKRQGYICAFLDIFGRSVIEYDTEAFRKISFLMEWQDFFFIITIALPAQFPQRQPSLTFHSVYHQTLGGGAYTACCSEYPYSPRWSAAEMATRARTYILNYLHNFREESVSKGSFK